MYLGVKSRVFDSYSLFLIEQKSLQAAQTAAFLMKKVVKFYVGGRNWVEGNQNHTEFDDVFFYK